MKLLLVDLSHIFWSTWHATAGEQVDTAALATLSRIDSLKSGFDRVAICCDLGPSWRKTEYPEYKGNRPERDPAAYDQLRRVREKLEAEGLPVLTADGFEADDIIATLAVKAPAAGYEVTIASGDKDLLQLVGGPVLVQSTNNGGARMDREAVRAKFGVYPEQLGDWLALVGDSSDNIKGLEGCGPKNATRLLEELGSLENMLATPDGITPEKMREKFIAQREQIKLARKLVSLSIDVPIDFEQSTAPRERKIEKGDAHEDNFEEQNDGFETQDSGATGSALAGKEGSPDGLQPAPRSSSGSGDVGMASPEPGAEAHRKSMKELGQSTRTEEERTRTASQATPAATGEVVATSTAIVLDTQDSRWTLALEPRNPTALMTYCRHLAESQMYRKFPNADAIMAVILRGRSMGLDMMTSLDGFHVIEGKPSPSAMLIVATVLKSGKAEYFELVEHDDFHATWETLRRGAKFGPKRHTFSVDDAHRIGLDRPTKSGKDSNWVRYPGPMCIKQSGVELARMVYPDVVANAYQPDELVD